MSFGGINVGTSFMAEKRPPLVRFEVRPYGVDEEASEREGRHIPRFVNFACITPFGSKDEFEKVAEDWLREKRDSVRMGLWPKEWQQHFEMQYEEWKNGNELPRSGTPIKTWGLLTPQQAHRLIESRVTTVEDLAAVPDTGLQMIGLDGRNLREMAQAWIAEHREHGAAAKEIGDLKELVRQQSERIAQMEKALAEMPDKRGPGRPRNSDRAAA